MRILPMAFLLVACASNEPRARESVEAPGTIVGEADLAVGRAAEAGSPPALLLELEPSGPLPRRLSEDLRAGRGWLRVERPRGFSFAGRDLLLGKGPFRPSTASFLFVQPRDGAPTLAEPALLRIAGSVDRSAIVTRIEPIDEPPGMHGDGLDLVGSADLRVLLGHGLDALLHCVGSSDIDTHHWIRLVDAEGASAPLLPALEKARVSRNLAELAPYRVLVRRRQPGDPVATHYRVRLDDVVVAAQARVVSVREGLDWTWEGVWSAQLAAPPAGGPDPWPGAAPPLEVRYKEYVRPSGSVTGTFWQGLLAPIALGADVGLSFLEGEGPLLDSVAERQRARN
ncbi:MAG: hypothetical protein L6Q95_00010 [Planctomycetes bacterium]|nr:hypothetical protein [Planctomycetota bacterium]